MKQNSSATSPIPGGRKSGSTDILRTLRKPYWIPVSGSSMRPLLRDGDFVLVKPLGKEDVGTIRPGMLILFVRQDVLIVHRFLGLVDGMIQESGDSSRDSRQIPADDLLGIVVSRKRGGIVKPVSSSFFWRLRVRLYRLTGR